MSSLWISATVDDAGRAAVVELIEWDFAGVPDRHGIYRQVPGMPVDAPVSAEVDGTDTTVVVEAANVDGRPGASIRVGDPATTVSGRHRYELGYPLSGLTTEDGRLVWDGVGTGWDVPIGPTTVHLVAPFELSELACYRGPAGSADSCDDARQAEAGHVTVTVRHIAAGEGITLIARRGPRLPAAPPVPERPA